LRQTGKQDWKPLLAPFFFPALNHRGTRQVELLAGRLSKQSSGLFPAFDEPREALAVLVINSNELQPHAFARF
jgi:hypothetical protein